MQKIIEENKCCGCSACINICPNQAIDIIEDIKGFKYPIINQDRCVDCGLCKKICPVLNSREEKKDIEAYACYNKNLSERLKSSSGGVFVLIAKEIIKRGGVVFGAVFDKDFNVKHSYTEKEKDIEQFMGSKYTQSVLGDSFKKVKEFLDDNRYVLFTGTPCQIEGLKSYLRRDYDKLYTQDLICHGVPSPQLWKKYLEYRKYLNKENIKDVFFRNKDKGWISYHLKISFDTKTYSMNFADDLYMKAFLNNICLRDSCYNCSFKKKYRISDITLADYWGIDDEHPGINDNKGISLIVLNSDKGKELFNYIKKELVYVETNLDNAIKYNPSMIESSKPHKYRQKFEKDIDKKRIDKLIKIYVVKSSAFKKIYRKIHLVLRVKKH